jgi:hypothetical protein
MRPLLTIRYSLFALVLAVLGAQGAAADGRTRGGAAYADPVYLGSQGAPGCKPGPRRRYQFGRRCVWGGGRAPIYTMRVPSIHSRGRRGSVSVVRNAAFTAQVPGSLRASAGPLGRPVPSCSPYFAAQLKCSDYWSSDTFVRALIDNPNPATYPTLDYYGIPAIDGVPPITIIDPKRAALGTGFDTGGDFVARGTLGSGIRLNNGDLIFRGTGGDLLANGIGGGDITFGGIGRGGDILFNGIVTSPLRSGGGDITFGGTGGDIIFNGIGGPLGFGGGGSDIIFNGLR